MNSLGTLLQLLSAASVGIYAGTMLTEAYVLVPSWRAMPAEEFFSWYARNGGRLHGFFGPVTWIAGLLALAAGIAAMWFELPGRWPAAIAAGMMLVAVATFFVYFKEANASFSSRSVGAGLSTELRRWANWHWARSVVSLGAAAAAVLSLWGIG